ncbi:MAG: hypothetical protein GF330_07235, partial [Candidatus Eisenbacteria bacterium]|nr:hypothetical protein [Candidatus Eisenbacteria bacterium]
MPGGLRTRISPRRSIRRLLALLILSAAAIGCAQIEPPSGGPEDRTPPVVTASHPESLAAGFGRGDTLALRFSESMDKGSVEDWLFLSPDPGRLSYQWDGNRLRIIPRDSLRAQTTYVLLLGTEAQDRRNNNLEAPYQLPFATGSTLSQGHLEGHVRTGRLNAGGHFVFAWTAADSDSVTAPPAEMEEALRRGQSDNEGRFSLPFLPLGETLSICALYDADENRAYDPKADLWACVPHPVTLTDTLPVRMELEVYLVYDDEPGTLEGTIVDSLCVRRFPPARVRAEIDSLRALLISAGRLSVPEDSVVVPDTLGPAAPIDSLGLDAPGVDTTAAVTDSAAMAVQIETDDEAIREWQAWESDTLATALDSLELARADSLMKARRGQLQSALEESAYCARPIWLEVFRDPDSAAVATRRIRDTFTVDELPPGTYWIQGFRDVDLSGERSAEEPQTELFGPIRLKPARTEAGLEIRIPHWRRPWPRDLLAPDTTAADTTAADTTAADTT